MARVGARAAAQGPTATVAVLLPRRARPRARPGLGLGLPRRARGRELGRLGGVLAEDESTGDEADEEGEEVGNHGVIRR